MIKIPYEQLLEKIKTEKNISNEEIEKHIQAKMGQLSGLISKEGAAHILANELGVKLGAPEGKIKINKILAGMRSIEIVGKVIRKYDIREFQSGERKGKVGSFVVGDETGTIRITCWHDQTSLMESLQENDIIEIKDGTVRENRGALEIHLNEKSKITKNPEGITVGEVKQNIASQVSRKSINDLKENDINIELLGTIVQVFDIKFYERCPQCRKRIKEQESGFQCQQHGVVQPEYGSVMNLYLDDGSNNIRVVFFANQIQQLLKKTDADLQVFRQSPETFEKIKTNLLGEMIKITGKASKNQMFDRLEFVVNTVDTNVNPEEEIARLKSELET
ncbi:hypothetical protein COV16_06355 [Candidatus Woesearchaeota archaeon CG10_big_fil_rev_8_21_14_0_10_34_8]|nr:MAG: hypothetical protein COV16_06355 [Candidatus Woesearchaeota archaeon CG10_big_fil_rev_8_21_14_0_10_34_8]